MVKSKPLWGGYSKTTGKVENQGPIITYYTRGNIGTSDNMRRNEGTRHTRYINPRSPALTMTCPLTEQTDQTPSQLIGTLQLSPRTPGTLPLISPSELATSRASSSEVTRPIMNTGSSYSIRLGSPDDLRPSDFWESPDIFASPQGRRQQEITSGRSPHPSDQDLRLAVPPTERITRLTGMQSEQQRLLETLSQRTYLHRYR